MVKNPNYWRKDQYGQQLPYLDQITFKPVTETTTLVNGLNTKLFDLVEESWAGMVDSDLTPLLGPLRLTPSKDAKEDTGPLRASSPRVERALDARGAALDSRGGGRVALKSVSICLNQKPESRNGPAARCRAIKP